VKWHSPSRYGRGDALLIQNLTLFVFPFKRHCQRKGKYRNSEQEKKHTTACVAFVQPKYWHKNYQQYDEKQCHFVCHAVPRWSDQI
jgi:hypothetical protein